MIAMLSLAALGAWAVIATIEFTIRDGYGRIPVRAAHLSNRQGSAAPDRFVQG
ncbi:MAG: hypothetical protein JWN09_1958 [Microbacteriaceae bacterium]|jgi:hypothetical protein|nr:hypothetical protein [Microbacteriaceae bacterium]